MMRFEKSKKAQDRTRSKSTVSLWFKEIMSFAITKRPESMPLDRIFQTGLQNS